MSQSKKPVKHWLHILLVILTGGLWLLVYIPLLILRNSKQISSNSEQNSSSSQSSEASLNENLNLESMGNYYDDWKDDRKAECPYCFAKLKKIPGAKTRCPACGFSMYVRYDPRTKSQRVVREEELELIEDERAKLNGTWEQRLEEKNHREQVKAELRKSFGTEPSEGDVQWRIYNENLLTHAKNRDWGLYRNTIHDMGKQLKKEGKLETALLYFMDVVYIDANGPSNSGKWGEDFEIMYLPHFAAEIFNITSKLGISEKVLFDKYKSRSEQLKESLKLKKSFEVCWKKFKEETDLDFS